MTPRVAGTRSLASHEETKTRRTRLDVVPNVSKNRVMPLPPPPGRRRGFVQRRLVFRRARLLAVTMAGLCIAASIGARDWGRPLFEWTDAQGVVRYTSYPERVPASRHDTLREVRQRSEEPGADPVALGIFDSSTANGIGVSAPSSSPGTAQGSPGGPSAAAAGSRQRTAPSALDREIAALEAKIARDQEILKTLISDPEAAPELSSSSDLATIARRLPQEQAELRSLVDQRERERNGETSP